MSRTSAALQPTSCARSDAPSKLPLPDHTIPIEFVLKKLKFHREFKKKIIIYDAIHYHLIFIAKFLPVEFV